MNHRTVTFVLSLIFVILLIGCAATEALSETSSDEEKGKKIDSGELIVSYDAALAPKFCWRLPVASYVWYSRKGFLSWVDYDNAGGQFQFNGTFGSVRVVNNRWDLAAAYLGVDLSYCKNGPYSPPSR